MKRIRKYEVTVLYKNGVKQTFKCRHFTINGETYSWENASPNILKLGVDDITAVWSK